MNTLLESTNIESWQQQTSFGHAIQGFHRQVENPEQRVHFLHGTGFSAGTLIPLMHLMPESWDCYISNIPGHGGSTWNEDRAPNWLEMADALAESIRKKMDVENKGPVVGIGHSFGGALTLIAASRNPDLFSRIILLDPIMIRPTLSVAQYFMRATGLWKKTASYKSVHNRKYQWPNAADMKAELSKKRLYRNFDPQVMEYFVQTASHINQQGQRELSCAPRWEASIFASFPPLLEVSENCCTNPSSTNCSSNWALVNSYSTGSPLSKAEATSFLHPAKTPVIVLKINMNFNVFIPNELIGKQP